MEDQIEVTAAEKQAHNAHQVAQNAATQAHNATQAQKSRQRQSLELQRERILDERTGNPNRRSALEAALADIEARLNELN